MWWVDAQVGELEMGHGSSVTRAQQRLDLDLAVAVLSGGAVRVWCLGARAGVRRRSVAVRRGRWVVSVHVVVVRMCARKGVEDSRQVGLSLVGVGGRFSDSLVRLMIGVMSA